MVCSPWGHKESAMTKHSTHVVQSPSHVRFFVISAGLPIPRRLLKSAQVHVHCIGDAISSSAALFSFCPQSFPASGAFPMSQAHHVLCFFNLHTVNAVVPIVC